MTSGDDRASTRLPIATQVVLACCAGGVKVCRRGWVYDYTPKRVRVLWFERDGRRWVKRGLVKPEDLRKDSGPIDGNNSDG